MIFVWTLDSVLFVVVMGVALLAWASIAIPAAFKEWRCKHDGDVGETRACDAICTKCGKNLGFIGTWREQHPN